MLSRHNYKERQRQQIKLIASLEKRLKCCTHRNQVFVGFGKKCQSCYIGICRDRTGMDKQKYRPYRITQRPQRWNVCMHVDSESVWLCYRRLVWFVWWIIQYWLVCLCLCGVQLHIAACSGYTRVMQLLIDSHASIDAVDNDSWQPIHCAAYWAQVRQLNPLSLTIAIQVQL